MTPQLAGAPRLIRTIGTDGAAEVHEGLTESGEPVYVRRVLPGLTRDPGRNHALQARLRDLRSVSHPLLLGVLDVLEEGDELWVVEERVEGTPLSALTAHARTTGVPLPASAALHIATQLCNALEGLHGQPTVNGEEEFILHLGLRPEAILVTESGGIKVGSFGLIRSPVGGPSGTMPSPERSAFLSPEQTWPDQKLSPPSDLFSLGAIVYELLVGEPLFQAESALLTLEAIRRADVGEAVRSAAVFVPGIERVLQRTLSLNPRHRYQRAFVLREDLRALMGPANNSVVVAELRELAANAPRPDPLPFLSMPKAGTLPPRPLPPSLIPADDEHGSSMPPIPLLNKLLPPPEEEEQGGEDLFAIDEVEAVSAVVRGKTPVPPTVPRPAPVVPVPLPPSPPVVPDTEHRGALAAVEGNEVPAMESGDDLSLEEEHSMALRLERAGLDRASVIRMLSQADDDDSSGGLPISAVAPPGAAPLILERSSEIVDADEEHSDFIDMPEATDGAFEPPPGQVSVEEVEDELDFEEDAVAEAVTTQGDIEDSNSRIIRTPLSPPRPPVGISSIMPAAPVTPLPIAQAPISQAAEPPAAAPPAVPLPAAAPPVAPPAAVEPTAVMPPRTPNTARPTTPPPLRVVERPAAPPEKEQPSGMPLAAVIGVMIGMAAVCGLFFLVYSEKTPEEIARVEAPVLLAPERAETPAAKPEPVAVAPEPIAVTPPVESPPVETPPIAATPDPEPTKPVVAARPEPTKPVVAARPEPAKTVAPKPKPEPKPEVVAKATRPEPKPKPEPATKPKPEPKPEVVAKVTKPTKPVLVETPTSIADLALATPGEPSTDRADAIDFGQYTSAASKGKLDPSAIMALETVETTDPDYTRSRALLLMDAERRKDAAASKRYLDEIMSKPENRYNPIFLTEQARAEIRAGRYDKALANARRAEQQWARLPSELVFSKKAEIYEIQAAASQGLFYASGTNTDLLDESIRLWQRYRDHVSTKGRKDLQAHADAELATLTELRERIK